MNIAKETYLKHYLTNFFLQYSSDFVVFIYLIFINLTDTFETVEANQIDLMGFK